MTFLRLGLSKKTDLLHYFCLSTAVLLGFLVGVPPNFAQQPPRTGQGREEPTTKFEQFLLTKGRVVVRESYDIGTLRSQDGAHFVDFEVLRVYTPGKKDSIMALRVEIRETVRETDRPSITRIGVLDAEEVFSLANALPQMLKMVETLKRGQKAYSTEVDFRAHSLRFGFVVSGGESRLFVHVGEIGSIAAFFDANDFTRLETLISQAAAKIQELRQR